MSIILHESRSGIFATLARAWQRGSYAKKKSHWKEISGSHSLGHRELRSMHMHVGVVRGNR